VEDHAAASALEVSTPTRGRDVSSDSLATRTGDRAGGVSRASAAPTAPTSSVGIIRLAAATMKSTNGHRARTTRKTDGDGVKTTMETKSKGDGAAGETTSDERFTVEKRATPNGNTEVKKDVKTSHKGRASRTTHRTHVEQTTVRDAQGNVISEEKKVK
jgi:hypothetical protein